MKKLIYNKFDKPTIATLKRVGYKGKIVVNVESADVFYFGARRVDVDELRERLLREKARATRETAVRIRANRDVPYGAIEPILILCAQTGFTDVSFAVVEN